MASTAECRCLCRFMTHEEADNRHAAAWHVDPEKSDALCSVQSKRYLRLERARLHTLNEVQTHAPWLGRPT